MALSRLPCCLRLWSVLVHGVNYRNVVFETIPVTFGIGVVFFIAALFSVHSQRLLPAAYESYQPEYMEQIQYL